MRLFPFLAVLPLLAQPLPRLGHAGFGLSETDGRVIVTSVREDTSAATAGLRPGDVLLNPPSEISKLFRQPHGTQRNLQIRRGSDNLTIPLVYRAPRVESQPDFDIVYGALAVDGHRRRLLTTKPRSTAKSPVVLFLAGSGCASQESADGTDPQVQLLYQFTRAGFRTVRVEKTGVGDSEGPACYGPSGDLDQEVRAYVAALSSLRPDRIFLYGHSAGASLVPVVLRAGGAVEAVVVAGGMGSSFFDYILEMRRRQLSANPKLMDAEMAIHLRCLHALLNEGKSPADIEAAMPDCRRRVRFDSPPSFVAQWAALDMGVAWSQSPRVPVLVMHGEHDQVTSLAQSRQLTSLIPSARLEILPMDHDGNEPGPPIRLHQGAVQAALRFFLKPN